MDELTLKVRAAQRRLTGQRFLGLVGWTLFASFLVALVGMAVPRVWVLEVDQQTWDGSWLGGAFVVGLLAAVFGARRMAATPVAAGIEIDRRFGLKERVSSTLSLSPEERESPAGLALVSDAARRIAGIEVAEQFPVRANWRVALPAVPALAAALLAFLVPLATPPENAQAKEDQLADEQIQRVAEVLKKKIERESRKAEELGLKDDDLFDKLEKGLNELAKADKMDRKEALVKLNDLAQEIKKRRDEAGPAEDIKKQLNQLNKLDQGPAENMAKALKQGDFEKAADEIKELKEKLEQNELDAAGQQKLAEQLQKMEQKLREQLDRQEQAKQDLQQQIQQKLAEGKNDEAAKLQQQLEQLQQQQPLADQLQKLADQMGQAAQNLKDGQGQQAQQNMQQMAQQMQQLQQQAQQMQQLDEMLDQIAQAKQAMQCPQCQGKGCAACQSDGDMLAQGDGGQLLDDDGDGQGKKPGQGGDGQDGPPGNGLGAGRGQGARPEEKNDTKSYDSQVAGKVNRGAGAITGQVEGPNVAGVTRHQVEEAVTAARSSQSDPLADQQVPKSQRTHAQQYFDRFREGK